MRTKSLLVGSAVLAVVVSGLVGSTAEATDPSVPPPAPTAPPENATLTGPLTAKQDGIKLKTRGDAIVRSFTLSYPVGSYSGWHSHPGIVLAVVKSGTVVRRLPCQRPQTFTVGQAFTEVGTHYVANYYTDTTNPDLPAAELLITQIVPAGTTVFRDDEPKPTCHHPKS